eukprot:204883_1
MSLCENTCAAIGRYYESLGKPYDAMFSKFCEDNWIDDDYLREEMDESPDDSTLNDCTLVSLVDFDDNFPFTKEPKDEEARSIFIFKLIKRCMENPAVRFGPTMTMSDFKQLGVEESKVDPNPKTESENRAIETINLSDLVLNDVDNLESFQKKMEKAKTLWSKYEEIGEMKLRRTEQDDEIAKVIGVIANMGGHIGYVGTAISFAFAMGSESHENATAKIIDKINAECTDLRNKLGEIAGQIQELTKEMREIEIEERYATGLDRQITNFKQKYDDLLKIINEKDESHDVMKCEFMKSFDNQAVMNTFETHLKFMLVRLDFKKLAEACEQWEDKFVNKVFKYSQYLLVSIHYLLTYHAIKDMHMIRSSNKQNANELSFANKQQYYAQEFGNFVSRFRATIMDIRTITSELNFEKIKHDIINNLFDRGMIKEIPDKQYTLDNIVRIQTEIWQYLNAKYRSYKWIVAVWKRHNKSDIINDENTFSIRKGKLNVTIGRMNARKMNVPWPPDEQSRHENSIYVENIYPMKDDCVGLCHGNSMALSYVCEISQHNRFVLQGDKGKELSYKGGGLVGGGPKYVCLSPSYSNAHIFVPREYALTNESNYLVASYYKGEFIGWWVKQMVHDRHPHVGKYLLVDKHLSYVLDVKIKA